MQAGEIRAGIIVSHAETGALGCVLRGGYRPRVHWYPNDRIVRTDEELLRFAFPDDIAMRKARCPNCKGAGLVVYDGHDYGNCPSCNGSGGRNG